MAVSDILAVRHLQFSLVLFLQLVQLRFVKIKVEASST